MEIFDQQNAQFEELVQEFEYILNIEKKMVKGTSALPSILQYLCENYNKHVSETSSAIYESLNKSAQVISQNTTGATNQISSYKRLSEIFSEVSTQISLLMMIVSNHLHPKIVDCVSNANKVLDNIFTKKALMEKQYKELRGTIFSNYSALRSMAKDITSASKKNDTAKLTSFSQQYMVVLKCTKILTRKLNQQFVLYDRFVKITIDKMKGLDRARSQVCLDFFLKLSDIYMDSSVNYLKVFDQMEQKYSKLSNLYSRESYLSAFINKYNIFRTNLSDVTFVPQPNPFIEDNDIILRPSHIKVPAIDYPLFVAKAIYDFDAKNINELSIKAGETLYLYEKPVGSWVLASHNRNFAEAFVPTNAITTSYTKMGMTMETKVSHGDFLGIYPTCHFIVEKDDGENYFVRNPQNQVGKVRKTDLLID